MIERFKKWLHDEQDLSVSWSVVGVIVACFLGACIGLAIR